MSTALIITGHPRSGTQVLQRMLNSHPEIALTNEFGCFRTLGVPATLYGIGILGRCWARRRLPILDQPGLSHARKLRRSYAFEARFLAELYQQWPPLVQAADVAGFLRSLFPGVRIVGDKLPDYVFNLSQFAGIDDLAVVVIYRDGRDVVASYLERLRNGWDRVPVFSQFDTPEKIARRWTEAVAQMQRYRNKLFPICYEELVQHPEREAERMGRWLDVDPRGFSVESIRASSVGRYVDRLSKREQQTVARVAGSSLNELGYA